MHKRTSLSASKTSSISRLQARKAVLGVKAARSGSGSARASSLHSAKKASSSFVERYLGHFGVGPSSTATKKSGAAKKAGATKKSVGKKSSATKNVHPAS